MRILAKVLFLTMTIAFSSISLAGEVSRAVFTIGVDNREPVIQVDSISSNSYNSITFFTELTELSGHNITHQWMYDGKVMFEKSFNVGGDRWRVWTNKSLLASWTGTWTVNVLDDDRTVLKTQTFEYQ